MARALIAIPIDIGSNRTRAVLVPSDVAEYFNITVPTATTPPTQIERTRKAYTRTVYPNGLGAGTPKTAAVAASRWSSSPKASKGGAGRAVRIPTELKTPSDTIRMVTLRFPSNAVTGAISKWLFEEIKAHKPSYFLLNGQRYIVAAATGIIDINPGEEVVTPP